MKKQWNSPHKTGLWRVLGCLTNYLSHLRFGEILLLAMVLSFLWYSYTTRLLYTSVEVKPLTTNLIRKFLQSKFLLILKRGTLTHHLWLF
jgi:hypothetical protein